MNKVWNWFDFQNFVDKKINFDKKKFTPIEFYLQIDREIEHREEHTLGFTPVYVTAYRLSSMWTKIRMEGII